LFNSHFNKENMSTTTKTQPLNKFSRTLTQEVTNPAAKAMLYGIGLSEADMDKAQIGIASTGYEGNTCNMHLNGLSVYVKQGVQANNMVGLIFNTIGVSDGMTNGNDGMRYSLPSRDLIADSIETVVQAQWIVRPSWSMAVPFVRGTTKAKS
jgi:dihydroxy-acid dehydratase